MPQPLNTPILRLLVGVLLDPPRFDISGGSPAIPPPILYPHFWGLITVEDGDSKGICGWEAWGRFWSRTRGMYEGGVTRSPRGRGDQPCLVDEKAYLFFTVQYLKRE